MWKGCDFPSDRLEHASHPQRVLHKCEISYIGQRCSPMHAIIPAPCAVRQMIVMTIILHPACALSSMVR